MTEHTTPPTEPEASTPAAAQEPGPSEEETRLQAVIADLQKEAQKHRKGKQEAKAQAAEQQTAHEAQLLANGEFKALAESQAAELDRLKAFETDASPRLAAAAADAAIRQEALDARIESMSPGDKALVASAGNLANQEALASRLLGIKPAANQVPGVLTGAAPSSGSIVDPKDANAMWALKQSDPAAYQKALANSHQPPQNTGSLGFLSRKANS